MNLKIFPYHIYVLFATMLLSACATPIAPTGGPADKTGPVLEYSRPESGTTGFSGRSIEFQFNEFINRSSAAQAVTVEPGIGTGYSLDWKRKKLILTFDSELPDSTTVIITLGGDLADTRGNKTGNPITLAVSTGDEIDNGSITGQIKSAETGEGREGDKVLLYRSPFDLNAPANYQAETDTGGVFQFSYLRAGRYRALYVNDRNRNKSWDRENEKARPFSEEFIRIEKDGTDTLDVLYLSDADTTAPEFQGIGLLSQNRLRLRFSENIRLTPDTKLNISDTLGGDVSDAYPLYILPEDNFVLMAQSNEALTDNNAYLIDVSGVEDAAGNLMNLREMQFTGSAQTDTTLQRIVHDNAEGGLREDEALQVVYATEINDAAISDSLVVVEGDVDFNDWPEITVTRNVVEIAPQGTWIEDVEYRFLLWNPVSKRRKIISPDVWSAKDYGSLLMNSDSADTRNYSYRLYNDNDLVRSGEFTGSGRAEALLPGSYRLIVFRDENGNGKWDEGTVDPYRKAEPYYVQSGLSVEPGFESEINLSFR